MEQTRQFECELCKLPAHSSIQKKKLKNKAKNFFY